MMQDADIIVYEQPLNESMRICLRLEALFAQLDYALESNGYWHHRAAVIDLLEILNVSDRPDLKSKLTQALNAHANSLNQLKSKPEVDQTKLQNYLKDLDQAIDYLYSSHHRLGKKLRENPFLQAIRPHLLSPGGVCAHNTPGFELWLKNAAFNHRENIDEWYQELSMLKKISKLLLELTRRNKKPAKQQAEAGFYQQSLDPSLSVYLVRISLAVKLNIFPEISIGRHRLSIHFYELGLTQRSSQCQKDIAFQLTCCSV